MARGIKHKLCLTDEETLLTISENPYMQFFLGLDHYQPALLSLSLEAYNESTDLINQAEAYKVLFGYFPELIQADKIYATHHHRKWCKENGVRLTASQRKIRTKIGLSESQIKKRIR